MRLGITVGAVAAIAAVWVAAGQSKSVVVIRLRSVSTLTVITDKSPKGVGKGDVWLEKDALANVVRQFGKPAKARVGTDSAKLTFRSSTVVLVTGTAILPNGTIHIRGTVSVVTTTSTLAVVGGTGAYAHARGVMMETGNDADTYNTYRLSLP